MFEKVGGSDVTVQVESTSEDNYVPDGIAVSSGIYDLPIVVDPSAVTPMGMQKVGDTQLDGSWMDITGWAAIASLTSTVIDANESLVIAETGSIMVSVSIDFYEDSWFNTMWWSNGMVRLVYNDEIVATKMGKKTVTLKKVLNVIAGGKLRIQAKGVKQNNFASYPKIRAGAQTKVEFEGYDASAIDFEEGMLYANDVGFYDDTWGRYVSSTHLKKGLPYATAGEVESDTSVSGSQETGYMTSTNAWIYLTRGSASGPILAQTRVPIAVYEGSKVDWSGTFRVRQTGSKDEQTEDGILTGLNVRFAIWGTGITTDEYGVDKMHSQEIMFYQVTLQAANSEAENMIEYVLPTFPEPATVPADVDSLFFTCSLVQVESELYSAGTFTTKQKSQNQGPTPPAKSSAEMKYFGWKHDAPLKINIAPPTNVKRVTTHPLSRTGVAYKNTGVFTNVKPNAKVTFFGMPNTATSINIHNYDGTTTGTLIGTYSALANESKTVTITPSGSQIIISKAGADDYFVESVINETLDTLTQVKTPQRIINYSTVTDQVAKISAIREEADTCTLTIDFSSESLDPYSNTVLVPGKAIRVMGRHYGEGWTSRPNTWSGEANYETFFTGVIKQVTTQYDYEDEPIIQVIAYDAGDPMDKTKPGVAFDTMQKYIPFFNRMGASFLIDGFDVGGPFAEMPDKFQYRPSSHGEYSLAASMVMTRNSLRGYTYVDRFNQHVFLAEAKTTTPFIFTDGTAAGDMSYGKPTKKIDTNAIVNQLQLEENTLDAEDFRGKKIGGEDGPPSDVRYPSEKKQTATFTNKTSVDDHGEISKSIPVVRGDGDLSKLYRGDYGEGFTEWAQVLLDQNSTPTLVFESITVPIKNSDEIRKICQLELLDPVQIVWKGTVYNTKIREIEHTIIPGKWFVELKFTTSGEMTIW